MAISVREIAVILVSDVLSLIKEEPELIIKEESDLKRGALSDFILFNY